MTRQAISTGELFQHEVQRSHGFAVANTTAKMWWHRRTFVVSRCRLHPHEQRSRHLFCFARDYPYQASSYFV